MQPTLGKLKGWLPNINCNQHSDDRKRLDLFVSGEAKKFEFDIQESAFYPSS
jgi:hypothetical protein